MSAKHVEYHQGAIADIKNAIAWYQERSRKAALDFIEELNRAERTTLGGSCCGVFLSLLSIQKKSPQLLFGPSLTAADYRIIGHLTSNPC